MLEAKSESGASRRRTEHEQIKNEVTQAATAQAAADATYKTRLKVQSKAKRTAAPKGSGEQIDKRKGEKGT